ncbi:FtsW/RodA/SpoVE family cell cycle protein [Flavobacterium sp.]|uniref:FtsW/RodA/SpoVE family cell cycle protein n=1 Tax=Flavobacterium sp. TaxID=239 RepID=UPI002FD9954A
MLVLIKRLRGDKVIWALVALLALFSFMPVFSASSNLAYAGAGTGNTVSYLVKHLVHVLLGFAIIYQIHKVPYHYYRSISRFLLPFLWILLAYTLFKGTVIAGANASRWIQLPFIGISFQPSTLAFIVLMVFVARYLSKTREEKITFKSSFIDLWIPVGITLLFILPANFSTAALIFAMILMLVFVGKYPIKYILGILGIGFLMLTFFILVAKAFPNPLTSRVDTWEARIERFMNDENQDSDEVYQIERAKTAIASGGIYGLGPGKSVQKNFLPQSSSDFIYAIIVEEFGLFGGLSILGIYLLLFFRFVIAAHKANTLFGKLVVVGLGFPIVFQAFINMGVAVELLPTTGQTLPLISSGGSSIWVTCLAIGIIINVTKKEEEIAQENAEKLKRDEALQKLIDKQLEEDSLETNENSEESNPMQAVLNKK